ncbi:hypothetical protein O1611_g1890 [Lasiodiplodia mahajangana]|uniref:Uncharacterized protein n=1 Tax=Lasiodiplodia mahajangana TaxID=1108764 RepID=A0ACC2JW39_9PEZI|nr:hypothetical protein O1611_g1890 [Lasiodiplodia mahajangana]
MQTPKTMLAAQFTAYNNPYEIRTIPVPQDLEPFDVLIKVAIASHCHTDFNVCRGNWSSPLPCTGSHEGAGTVVAVGSACGSGQLHPDSLQQPIMTCHHCSKQTCVTHRLPWHSGLTCQQFDESLLPENLAEVDLDEAEEAEADIQAEEMLQLQRAKDEAASRELVRRESKPCPGCRFDIQKEGGCDQMTYERYLIMIQCPNIIKVASVVMFFVGYAFLLTVPFSK